MYIIYGKSFSMGEGAFGRANIGYQLFQSFLGGGELEYWRRRIRHRLLALVLAAYLVPGGFILYLNPFQYGLFLHTQRYGLC